MASLLTVYLPARGAWLILIHGRVLPHTLALWTKGRKGCEGPSVAGVGHSGAERGLDACRQRYPAEGDGRPAFPRSSTIGVVDGGSGH
jgi:hypothetical protein